MSENSSTLS